MILMSVDKEAIVKIYRRAMAYNVRLTQYPPETMDVVGLAIREAGRQDH
jgi:hypothetical protein